MAAEATPVPKPSPWRKFNEMDRNSPMWTNLKHDESWKTVTENLVIRPLTPWDFDAVLAIIGAPEAKKMSGDEWVGEKFIHDVCGTQAMEKPSFEMNWMCFGVFNKSDEKTMVGTIQLSNQVNDGIFEHFKKVESGLTRAEYNKSIGIGYNVAVPLWGKGIMTEAVKGIIGFIKKNFPDVTAIYAASLVSNKGSNKILSKTGFKLLGEDEIEDKPHTLHKLVLKDQD